jgi:hypothetical protein
MATARTPQDRKPARKAATAPVQRPSTDSEIGATQMRAAGRVAAGRRSSAARKPPTSSQEFAAEIAPAATVRPAGMPDLRPIFELHRRDRAKYLRGMDVFTSGLKANKELREISADGEVDTDRLAASPSILKVTADLAEMAADVEDVLVLVAVEPDEFRIWARKATDEALLQGFSWYQESASPGEA